MQPHDDVSLRVEHGYEIQVALLPHRGELLQQGVGVPRRYVLHNIPVPGQEETDYPGLLALSLKDALKPADSRLGFFPCIPIEVIREDHYGGTSRYRHQKQRQKRRASAEFRHQ